jgi:hypothetical protein
MSWRRHPFLYEINTWPWLNGLTARFGRPVQLGNVPAEVWDEIAAWGFDAVWLMGVWERSPRGKQIALAHPGLQADFGMALPGYTQEQVVGSPYAVREYTVAEALGGREGLAICREELRRRGMLLILDFVPNHVAVDQPWTVEHPDALVQGEPEDLSRKPGSFFTVEMPNGETRVYAHGRDPYFPAWTDTVQVDAFSDEARRLALETMLDIAAQCDGVRCDMAMLTVNRIFTQTWGRMDIPEQEYWEYLINPVKARHPEFVFIAEVYWDMEYELQCLGFDFTYDKRLYDRMKQQAGREVRDHLMAPLDYQEQLVRFIENHDEVRAATGFPGASLFPAAALVFTLPGMKLVYEGQLEGRRVKLPVQLGAAPEEAPQPDISAFYRRLMQEARSSIYHDGAFMMLGFFPMHGEESGGPLLDSLIAYAWVDGDEWRLVAANITANPVSARLMMARDVLSALPTWQVEDMLGEERDVYEGDRLLAAGLPVELEPYGFKILRVTPSNG